MLMHGNHFSASPTPLSEFRHDINGLKAWAIFAVIFYHFNVPGFSGGFVDVFLLYLVF
jgi:peptidoglycan/LPS O-acetylase OafA/YrhL